MKMILGIFFLLIILGTNQSATARGLPIAGFSDIGFKYVSSETGTNTTKTNNFYQGGLDFYYTKNIGQGVNALAEVVFELDNSNTARLDVERLWLQKSFGSWFKVKLGRTHTALGYWNDTFHHGTWLQNSVSRPLMYHFEDNSGILPMHSMGLEFRGSGKMGSGTFGYIANIANGRGVTVDPPKIVNDANRGKAFNLLAYYELKSGLRIGGVIYTDDLPSTPTDSTDTATYTPGKELISGAHLIYKTSKIEFLSEYLNIRHQYHNSAALKTNTYGLYSQLSYVMGKTTPYVRYDLVQADKDNADLYFSDYKKGEKNSQIVAGLRYDLTYTSAIKFEYSYYKKELLASTTKDNSVNVNWSFTW